MKEKIRLSRTDYHRVILTEVLPYETPIIFTNRLLYKVGKTLSTEPHRVIPTIRKILEVDNRRETIAFEYTIRQGTNKTRTLGVMHPSHQLKFPSFYSKYESLIVSLCQRSSFSLRHPIRAASYFYSKENESLTTDRDDADDLKVEEVEADASENDAARYAGSYFYYSRYNQLYKFVDSPEFLGLERRYHRLLKFDIKRCFASIYTHSISWAVKGKEFAKQHRGRSFDADFDRLMQQANYNETNGIVVGPEISRIFAELILQRVDLNIARQTLLSGIEQEAYAIRRYLDDYFLFSSSPEHERIIFGVVQECLQEYKMYINEAKTSSYLAPFITPQSVVKSDVQAYLRETVLNALSTLRREIVELASLTPEDRRTRKFASNLKSSTHLIRDIKIALSRSNQAFDIISSYSLSSILRSCYRLHRATLKHGQPRELQVPTQNLLTTILEIVFYVYSMDFRVRTTYLVSQILIVIGKLASTDERLGASLQSRIWILSKTILESRRIDELGGVEISNLLVALRAILPNHHFTINQLKCYFRVDEKIRSNALTYFDIVSLLYYIRDNEKYLPLHSEICSQLKKQLEGSSIPALLDTEQTLIFFDVMACPFLEEQFKFEVGRNYLKRAVGVVPNDHGMSEIVGYCTNNLHFINWSSELELERLLLRKQLSPGY